MASLKAIELELEKLWPGFVLVLLNAFYFEGLDFFFLLHKKNFQVTSQYEINKCFYIDACIS